MPLLEEGGAPKKPRTGYLIREAPKANTEVPTVEDPTAQYTYAPGSSRAGLLNNPGAASFVDIQNGYQVDSYIRQSAAKYAEKVWREGHCLYGQNAKAIEYINARFDMMTAASPGMTYWEFPLRQATRDYVKMGTGFLIKARLQKSANIFGQKKTGMRRTATPAGSTKPPVGAYFAVAPQNLQPIFDTKTNKLINWKQQVGQESVEFDLEDVIQLAYDRQPGAIYGNSYLGAVLDDVRALRQCEEMIIHLIFKSLNPLIHHEVPDTTGTGLGDQSDVDAAASEHSISAVNGYLVTPPNHKITVLGMESKALRAEGYLDILKHRVYAGLGVSDLIMGEATSTSVGASDSFSGIMNDRVRWFQRELADYFTYNIVWELLIEGGFNPIFDEKDRVYWRFNEVDVDRRIREEAHSLLLYQGNGVTEDEFRTSMNRPILADADRAKLYLNLVQIPLAEAGSQSEAVSGTGNKSNSTRGSGSGSSSANQSAASQKFITELKKMLSDTATRAIAAGSMPTVDTLLPMVESCARTVSALYGSIPESVLDEARLAVRATFETHPNPTTARQFINSLYGWLNTNLRT